MKSTWVQRVENPNIKSLVSLYLTDMLCLVRFLIAYLDVLWRFAIHLKDDKSYKSNNFENISNAIRIHHAYASVATDYKKKQCVFRLKTADWAEYLFQTSNVTELNDWVNIINLIAAMFSSPALSSPVGSANTFQRPLLPVSCTRYTLQEQYDYHKKHAKQLHIEFNRLETIKDEKNFDKDKYNYYAFEVI